MSVSVLSARLVLARGRWRLVLHRFALASNYQVVERQRPGRLVSEPRWFLSREFERRWGQKLGSFKRLCSRPVVSPDITHVNSPLLTDTKINMFYVSVINLTRPDHALAGASLACCQRPASREVSLPGGSGDGG